MSLILVLDNIYFMLITMEAIRFTLFTFTPMQFNLTMLILSISNRITLALVMCRVRTFNLSTFKVTI